MKWNFKRETKSPPIAEKKKKKKKKVDVGYVVIETKRSLI